MQILAASLLVLALSSGVTAQLTTFGVCDPTKMTSGFLVTEHPQTCEKFILCQGNLEYALTCGAGTLYNSRIGLCDFPQNFNCSAWRDPLTQSRTCGQNRQENFAASCCGGYFRCENGAVNPLVCPNNLPFNANTKSCEVVGSTCSSTEPRCTWRNTTTTATQTPLSCATLGFQSDPTNNCKYFRTVGAVRQEHTCPVGTQFDMTTCGCNLAVSGPCVAPVDNGTSTPCSSSDAQFRLSVSNFRATGVYQGGEKYLELLDVSTTANDLRFSGATGSNNVVLIPFFANNERMFKKDFGLRVTFSLDNPQTNVEYDILSNEEGSNPQRDRNCESSVYLKVLDNGAVRTITFQVQDASGRQVSIQANNVPRSQSWIRVTVGATKEGQLSGKVDTASDPAFLGSQGQPVTMSSQSIATPIKTNQCALGLGRRYNRPNNLFRGQIREVTAYLNCVQIGTILQ